MWKFARIDVLHRASRVTDQSWVPRTLKSGFTSGRDRVFQSHVCQTLMKGARLQVTCDFRRISGHHERLRLAVSAVATASITSLFHVHIVVVVVTQQYRPAREYHLVRITSKFLRSYADTFLPLKRSGVIWRHHSRQIRALLRKFFTPRAIRGYREYSFLFVLYEFWDSCLDLPRDLPMWDIWSAISDFRIVEFSRTSRRQSSRARAFFQRKMNILNRRVHDGSLFYRARLRDSWDLVCIIQTTNARIIERYHDKRIIPVSIVELIYRRAITIMISRTGLNFQRPFFAVRPSDGW